MNEKAEHNVVTSEVMAAPMLSDAFARRNYPMLSAPEAVHARLWGDQEHKIYHLNYNGHDIIMIRVTDTDHTRVRCYSDGNVQSAPFIQQFMLQAKPEACVEVEFSLPCEMVAMRPRRAQNGEGILAQVGHPLPFSVNGLYVLDWDLLISWHGYDFSWVQKKITCENGLWRASLLTNAGIRPLIILLRPRYYKEHLGYRSFTPWERRINAKAVAGWCSWEAYHNDIKQRDVDETAMFLEPLGKYGLEYMQVDDGFEKPLLPEDPNGSVTSAWMETNEKFQDGHAGIIHSICAHGFKPGLWVAPNITNIVAMRNNGFCLKNANGSPLLGDWIRGVIDCHPSTLEAQIIPFFRSLRDSGYEYIKIDGFRHLTYDGFHEAVRLGYMNGDEAFDRVRAYAKAARVGLGDNTYLMACWGVITPAMGIVDAMRISTDSNPSWAAASMQLYEMARWFFAQRILFTIDPDHVCVRTKFEWARTLLSLVSLTGSLYMISDKPSDYDTSRLELIKKTIPPLETRALETGAVDLAMPFCARSFGDDATDQFSKDITFIDDDIAPFSSLWAIHIEKGGRCWCVTQRCATVPLGKTEVPLEKLSLDPQKVFFMFDFWKQEPKGIAVGKVCFDELALGDTQVISLYDITSSVPCLVGCDRHISMDAVSVQGENWDENAQRYTLWLSGFPGQCTRYCIFCASRNFSTETVDGATAEIAQDGDVCWLQVNYTKEIAYITLS